MLIKIDKSICRLCFLVVDNPSEFLFELHKIMFLILGVVPLWDITSEQVSILVCCRLQNISEHHMLALQGQTLPTVQTDYISSALCFSHYEDSPCKADYGSSMIARPCRWIPWYGRDWNHHGWGCWSKERAGENEHAFRLAGPVTVQSSNLEIGAVGAAGKKTTDFVQK